jgi:hypothetical protein
MNKVADRRPPVTSPGMTSPLDPPPDLPSADAAREFYLHGMSIASPGTWYQVKQHHIGWTFTQTPESIRFNALIDLVAQQLQRLRLLSAGWDGGSAQPITGAAIYGAAGLLARLLDAASEPPQIFPLTDGGVQIEWYAAGDEIDIDVDSQGTVHVLATAPNGETVIEGSADPYQPSQILSDLSKYVREFSEWVAQERRRA